MNLSPNNSPDKHDGFVHDGTHESHVLQGNARFLRCIWNLTSASQQGFQYVYSIRDQSLSHRTLPAWQLSCSSLGMLFCTMWACLLLRTFCKIQKLTHGILLEGCTGSLLLRLREAALVSQAPFRVAHEDLQPVHDSDLAQTPSACQQQFGTTNKRKTQNLSLCCRKQCSSAYQSIFSSQSWRRNDGPGLWDLLQHAHHHDTRQQCIWAPSVPGEAYPQIHLESSQR